MTLGELRQRLAEITDLPESTIVILDVEGTFYGELQEVSWDEESPEYDTPCVWLYADPKHA